MMMKSSLINLAVISAFSFSFQSHAGFVTLPSTGFSTSAYTNCYNNGRVIPSGGIANNVKGNFGSYPIAAANYPATGSNDTCWVAKPASTVVLPAGKTGYTLVGSRSVPIPPVTGAPSGFTSIGTVTDIAWRNSTTNMCIISTQVIMTNADHDSGTPGTQYFEVNDVARGGFSGSTNVDIAYTIFTTPVTTASPVYRAGRTFTSVQHRALAYDTLANKEQNGTNYLDLPTKNSVNTAITGENTPIGPSTPASTTLATQDAVVNSNWVDFTLDTVYVDDDGSTNAASAFTYIEASCNAAPTVTNGNQAIRLRQTAQENTTFKEIAIDGYAIGSTP
ncbi:hypothetical protein [Methylobacillus sp. Pita1]|uniref:hypothetical protein n=1 Tax=Methylobacillus sp. Pita1 TaxID=3382642 RepID=UPI0038B643B7